MPKRILSQTLKRPKSSRKEHPADEQSTWSKFKDVVATLGTATGVFAGVLWLGGRFYAYGYFEQMGIPLFFLNFPFGEYAENYLGTIVLDIVTFILNNHQFIIIVTIATVLFVLILLGIQKHYKKLRLQEAILRIENLNNRFLVAILVLLFLFSFISAYRHGAKSAYQQLTLSRSITVYSENLLPLGSPSKIETSHQEPSLYEFSGLHLLTYNSGKYYLFRELDLVACKPKEVFIISDSNAVSVDIKNSSVANFTCSNPPN